MAASRGSASSGSNYSEEEKDRFEVNFTFTRPRRKSKTTRKSNEQNNEDHNDSLPIPSPTIPSPNDENTAFDCTTNGSGFVNNIYLHIHDEESRNYTQITTYHGMVRIFNSHTWASLIFWSLVVLTCLTLFMVYCSNILYKFHRAPTFMESFTYVLEEDDFPNILVCPLFRRSLSNSSLNDPQTDCLKYSNVWKTINGHSSVQIQLDDAAFGSFAVGYALSLKAPSDRLDGQLYADAVVFKPGHRLTGIVHKSSTKWIASQREKTCYSHWSETGLTEEHHRTNYSMDLCEQLRQQRARIWKKSSKAHLVINCLPSCESHRFRMKHSVTRTWNHSSIINLSLDRRQSKHRIQQRRIQVVDVLSAIGGGTSLFLGCSCVTLMETFVYLARSIWQTVVGPSGKCHHFAEDDEFEPYEKTAFEGHCNEEISVTTRNAEMDSDRTEQFPAEFDSFSETKDSSPQRLRPNKIGFTRLPSVDEANEYSPEAEPEVDQLLGPLNFLRRAPSLLSSSPSSASTATRLHLIDHRKRRPTSAYHTNVLSHF